MVTCRGMVTHQTWILSVIAKYFSSVNNILKVVNFVLNKNITSVYSDFPCFSFRGAVQFSLLLWQYEDHYSENLKIPQITGYFHCIESTFQEIAEKKLRSRYLFLDGCALRRERCSSFPYFLTLFIPETSDRDLAWVLFRWCEAEGGAGGGVGLDSPRMEVWVWNSCGLGDRRVSRVDDTCLAWDTCIEGSLWPETRAIKCLRFWEGDLFATHIFIGLWITCHPAMTVEREIVLKWQNIWRSKSPWKLVFQSSWVFLAISFGTSSPDIIRFRSLVPAGVGSEKPIMAAGSQFVICWSRVGLEKDVIRSPVLKVRVSEECSPLGQLAQGGWK